MKYLVRSPLLKLRQQARIILALGLLQYIKYRLKRKGQKLPLKLYSHNIWVRKGTPDLSVALGSLAGEFDILEQLVGREFAGTIIDAGGYIGTATMAMRELFPSANITVIEPSLENFEILRRNLEHYSNITLKFGALIGSELDSVTLKDRGTGEWGLTIVDGPSDCPDPSSLAQVPAFKLGSLVSEGQKLPMILKLDIEGSEHDLLLNDTDALSQFDIIIAELHDRIVPGCEELFLNMPGDRIVFKGSREKFVSVKRSIPKLLHLEPPKKPIRKGSFQ